MQQQILQTLEYLSDEFPDISYVSEIKSGKEAEVHLVSWREQLFALKQFKTHTKFSTRGDYVTMAEIGDSRAIRAIRNKSRAGARLMKSTWANREGQILKKLYHAGANVPFIEYIGDDFLLMEYLGTLNQPAPRLSDIELEHNMAEISLEIIIEHLQLFLELGFAHGDLSAYNILWYQDQPYFIDFPQILYFSQNQQSAGKFQDDIYNLRSYFEKYGFRELDLKLNRLSQEVSFLR